MAVQTARHSRESDVGMAAFERKAAQAASLLKLPTLLHEQNAVMGRANRFLAARVKIVATGFPEVGLMRAHNVDVELFFAQTSRVPFGLIGRKDLDLKSVADLKGKTVAVTSPGSLTANLARYFKRPPDQLGPDQLRQYQAYLFRERKLAPNTVTQRTAALRFFFVATLRRPWAIAETPYHRKLSAFRRVPQGHRIFQRIRD